MDILFKDDDIIVVVKPAGLASEASEKHDSVPSLIERETGEKPFCVHRLDRETRGVMVYALNSRAAAALTGQITDKTFRKSYYAVFAGELDEPKGKMTDLLYHDKQKNKSFVVKRERKGVRDARLGYEVLAGAQGLSLAQIELDTGRTHQIRVQFASRKHPLFGDKKYGGAGDRLALFAFKLEFLHPSTGEKMCFKALPEMSEYPWSLFSTAVDC